MSAPKASLFVEDSRTKSRKSSEKRFRAMGLGAVGIAIAALVFLLSSVLGNGVGAFRQSVITLDLTVDPAIVAPKGAEPEALQKVTTIAYKRLLDRELAQDLAAKNIDTSGVSAKQIAGLMSQEAPAVLRRLVLADPSLIGQTITFNAYATSRVDGFLKGRVTMESAKLDSNISPEQLELATRMKDAGLLRLAFNPGFLTAPDASELRPEVAGLGVAILGSAYMMLIVLCLALPLGVAASIYLEEFAPKNRLTDLIEVNISNLAAVPSIVFGILGLAIFINFAGMPQSAPIVGGLVLTLMTLPTIIISTRAALKAVPPSIRDAALGVGASKMQSIFHHVLPLAMPGILTGTIIGLAQALGETAPLLLIGMVAFVRDYPGAPPEGFFDPASALPVQVYNWTTRADQAFMERASGAIIVLLVFLVAMNAIAILLRRRFERRW